MPSPAIEISEAEMQETAQALRTLSLWMIANGHSLPEEIQQAIARVALTMTAFAVNGLAAKLSEVRY